MDKIKINILILNWNNRKILSECIQSILVSTYENYVITVIDNGSTDDSVNYIKSNFNMVNIIEVPVVFTDREFGKSKMSTKIIREAVFGVVKMKLKSLFKKYNQNGVYFDKKCQDSK